MTIQCRSRADRSRPVQMRAALWTLLFAASMTALGSTEQARAACDPPEGPRFTSEIANRFIQNPSKILSRSTTTYGLTVFVMQFAAARPRDLDVFRAILPNADTRQQEAIGLGFYRAETFCRIVDSATADRIANWVSKLPVRDVVAAYQQAVSLHDVSGLDNSADTTAQKIENRLGDGLDLIPKPSPSGVGSLKIPDPTRLPGD